MEYRVKIDAFEGPLDLLLHLVNRLEIDIYDISVSEITDQYLDFIHRMKELQLDVAAEYLLMASTLLAIKSQMLLPAREDEPLDEEFAAEPEPDPREALIHRLMLYRKYKLAAEQLRKRGDRWKYTYSKPAEPLEAKTKPLTDASLYDMLSALHKLVKRKQLRVPRQTKLQRREISVQSRMEEIMAALNESSGRKSFFEFYSSPDRTVIVTTFLAMLELMKNQQITCEQEDNFKNIVIYRIDAGGGRHGENISD